MSCLRPEDIEVFLNEKQGVLDYKAKPHSHPQVISQLLEELELETDLNLSKIS